MLTTIGSDFIGNRCTYSIMVIEDLYNIKCDLTDSMSRKDDAMMLWQAAFCRRGQLQRQQWLQVDLVNGLRAIRTLLRRGDRVSLSYVSTLFFGLCRIMSCQTSHTFANISWPSLDWLEFEHNTKRTNKRRASSVQATSAIERLFRTDPYLQTFVAISDQFDNFSEPMTSTIMTDLVLPFDFELPSLNANQVTGAEDENQSKFYFDQLYGQVDSVNFVDEFQDLLEQHFGKPQKEQTSRRSARFSQVHVHQSPLAEVASPNVYAQDDFDIYEQVDIDLTENKENDQSLMLNTFGPSPSPVKSIRRKSRKKRTNRSKRAKNLFGLKRHFDSWRKTKNGYRRLVQETTDSKLTEPSRSMTSELKAYYNQGANGTRPCIELDFEHQVEQSFQSNGHKAFEAFIEPPIQSASFFDDGEQCGDYLTTTIEEVVDEVESNSEHYVDDQLKPELNVPRDREMAQLLNKTLRGMKTSLKSKRATVAGEPAKQIQFSNLLHSLPIQSRQMAAQSFFTLLHMSVAPNSGIELHQQSGRQARRSAVMKQFGDIIVSLKWQ